MKDLKKKIDKILIKTVKKKMVVEFKYTLRNEKNAKMAFKVLIEMLNMYKIVLYNCDRYNQVEYNFEVKKHTNDD